MQNNIIYELRPVLVASSRQEFENWNESPIFYELRCIEEQLIATMGALTSYEVNAYCVPCGKLVPMVVDMDFGGRYENGRWVPNWRERLVCPSCKLNNRQRLVATLLLQEVYRRGTLMTIYLMEQVTPFYAWAKMALSEHTVIGSEYLGPNYRSGQVVMGILHEDAESLSFESESIDIIVSNDVFEHVSNPDAAFRECYRVLRSGGIMLATFPFHSNNDVSVVRAEYVHGTIIHHHEPVYHGDPLSPKGSLVFTDFGWDVLDRLRSAGFVVYIEVYASKELGHLGGGQLVFRCNKYNRSSFNHKGTLK